MVARNATKATFKKLYVEKKRRVTRSLPETWPFQTPSTQSPFLTPVLFVNESSTYCLLACTLNCVALLRSCNRRFPVIVAQIARECKLHGLYAIKNSTRHETKLACIVTANRGKHPLFDHDPTDSRNGTSAMIAFSSSFKIQ